MPRMPTAQVHCTMQFCTTAQISQDSSFPRIPINASWEGSTPLDAAVSRGNLEVVTTVIDRGVDVHRTLPTGRTVLYLAALHDRVEVARFLIQRGSNVNARDKQGVTPLNEAIYKNQLSLIDLLLAHEANLRAKRESGNR